MRKQNGEGGGINLKPEVLNFNLRNNLRKTGGGEGVIGNLRFYLRKTRGEGGGSGAVFSKRKRKELEVFPDGP